MARERGGSHFIAEGLQEFRQRVPFASAWWGEMSASDASAPPLNWMHGRIDLPDSFVSEWREVAGLDCFAHDSFTRLGEVMRDSEFTDPNEPVNVFARRHDLYHLMNITFELPESGLYFFVCLYRGVDGALFCEGRNRQLELGHISALKAVEHGTYIDELADLLPPVGPSNEPAEEGRVDGRSIGAKKHEVLPERELGARFGAGDACVDVAGLGAAAHTARPGRAHGGREPAGGRGPGHLGGGDAHGRHRCGVCVDGRGGVVPHAVGLQRVFLQHDQRARLDLRGAGGVCLVAARQGAAGCAAVCFF